MYHIKIKYTDYAGNQREETFWFNLNRAELLDLEFRTPGGLENYMKMIIETIDGQKLADTFKMLIDKSYGIRSSDGRRFMKSPEILKNFTETEAYAELYMMLATDSKKAAEFFNGIFPKVDVEEAKKEAAKLDKNQYLQQVQAPVNPVPSPAPQMYVYPQEAVPMVEGQQVFPPIGATDNVPINN